MRSLGMTGRMACALMILSAPVSAQYSLTTTFASNNGLSSSGATVYLDITVQNPVRITALDINSYASTGSPIGLNVFTCPNGYQANIGNAAAWTQVAADNGAGVAAGRDLPSNVPLAVPFVMTPGTYGMAIESTVGGQRYTNGNGSNQVYSDSFMTLSCGASTTSRFTGTPFTPRVWNGAIHYTPGQGLYASFEASPRWGQAPLTVQFTDTSFSSSPGGVTSWAWDFDEDGITDSTLQNPSFTFVNGGFHDVTLTVTDATYPASTLTRSDLIGVITNDECAGALPVVIGQNGPFTNRGATTSTPSWPCGGGASDVWFHYTSACQLTVQFSTCSGTNFDTTLEVFDGTCGALTSLGCDDDTCDPYSSVTVPILPGSSYYVRVGGRTGEVGDFDLTLAVTGDGSFRTLYTGCGSTTLSASGSPNLGGRIDFTLGGFQAAPLIWIGMIRLDNPICPPEGCKMGATFDIMFATPQVSIGIPCDPTLDGQTFYVQGSDFGGPGGCSAGVPISLPMTLTHTIATTIG